MPDAAGGSRAVNILVGGAAAVIVLAALHQFSAQFAPIFLALTLVVCVHPLLRWLMRHGWPGWLAATVSVIVLYVVLLALIVALAISVAKFGQLVVQYAGKTRNLADSSADFLHGLGVSNRQIQDAVRDIDPKTVLGLAGSLLGKLGSSLTSIAIIVATALFMTADAVGLPARLTTLRSSRPEVADALDNFASGVRSYWLVSTVFGLIVAVLDTAALFWIGVPLALVWGLLSFLTNYIPNIGFVIGLVPPALLALLDGGIARAVIVIAVYIVLNVVIQSIIQPRFTGDAVGLTVTASFVSLILWGYVLGPLGALLALPMSLFVKTLLVDTDPRLRWVDLIVSSKPPTGKPAETADG